MASCQGGPTYGRNSQNNVNPICSSDQSFRRCCRTADDTHTGRTRYRSQAFLTKNKDRLLLRSWFPPLFYRSVYSCLIFYQRLSPLLDFHETRYRRPLQNLTSKSQLRQYRLNFSRTFRKMVNYSLGLLFVCSDRFWMKFGTEYLHAMAFIRFKFRDNEFSAKQTSLDDINYIFPHLILLPPL